MPIILAVLIGISVFISGNYVYQHKGDFFPSPTPTAKIQDTITPTPQLNPTSTNIYIIPTTLPSTNNQNTNNQPNQNNSTNNTFSPPVYSYPTYSPLPTWTPYPTSTPYIQPTTPPVTPTQSCKAGVNEIYNARFQSCNNISDAESVREACRFNVQNEWTNALASCN